MQVRNARDLGLLIKDQRRSRSLSQAELAERIGASRHWVMSVEAGKPTVEVGLVLATLAALGLVCNVRPAELRGSSTVVPVDFSSILSRTRASGRKAAADARSRS